MTDGNRRIGETEYFVCSSRFQYNKDYYNLLLCVSASLCGNIFISAFSVSSVVDLLCYKHLTCRAMEHCKYMRGLRKGLKGPRGRGAKCSVLKPSLHHSRFSLKRLFIANNRPRPCWNSFKKARITKSAAPVLEKAFFSRSYFTTEHTESTEDTGCSIIKN